MIMIMVVVHGRSIGYLSLFDEGRVLGRGIRTMSFKSMGKSIRRRDEFVG